MNEEPKTNAGTAAQEDRPGLDDLAKLPKSYEITITLKVPYSELRFNAKSQFMGERFFEIQEANTDIWHWIPVDQIHRLSFAREFDELIEFRKRVLASEKQPTKKGHK